VDAIALYEDYVTNKVILVVVVVEVVVVVNCFIAPPPPPTPSPLPPSSLWFCMFGGVDLEGSLGVY